MFKYCNPHPQGKIVGDCVKRAITIATGKDYREISKELNRFKKVHNAECFNDWNRNVVPYMVEILGATKLSFPAIKGEPRMNGTRFCNSYPKGVYVLQMSHHIVCCKDGELWDTWDCSEKCVYTAYKIS